MKWETQGGMPTKQLLVSQISEKLTELQELFNMWGHITIDNDEVMAHGLHGVAELMQKMKNTVGEWATKGLKH